MKLCTTILLLIICFSSSAQQRSVNIPVTQDHRSDGGFQIESIEDGYLIIAQCKCHVDALYSDCLGLLKIDELGNTIWSHIYDGSPDMNLYSPVGDAMVLLGDTIVVCGKIDKVDHTEIRLMSFDMEGALINQEDIAIPDANELFIRGMLVVGDSLMVYGEVNNGERKIYLYFLDHQFNVLGHKLIGNPNLSKGFISLRKKKSEGFILAYSEPHPNSTSINSAVIADLNDSFEVVFTKKILEGGNLFPGIEIFETEDKGYMLGWYKDLSDTIVFPPLYPYPPAIYKLDSLANLEWEYVFAHRTAKEFISCIETNDGKMFGIGASDYFSANDIYDRSSDGFCFLIDTEGNLLWERVIADLRDSRSGRFWHAVHNNEDGYAI
ncbi:MAG: hypothetical protein ACI8YQ_003726, partial [Polaribacter sp.]